MPSDFWEDIADENEFSFDEVERFHVVRGSEGWDVYADTESGEMIPLAEDISDESMEELFWNDLYFWAMDNEVDVDREIAYSAE
jgi:hypothetical protein